MQRNSRRAVCSRQWWRRISPTAHFTCTIISMIIAFRWTSIEPICASERNRKRSCSSPTGDQISWVSRRLVVSDLTKSFSLLGGGSLFDGSVLASEGDIIVVTMNFRLNYHGFLSTGDDRLKGIAMRIDPSPTNALFTSRLIETDEWRSLRRTNRLTFPAAYLSRYVFTRERIEDVPWLLCAPSKDETPEIGNIPQRSEF